jgi:hypothetical protein
MSITDAKLEIKPYTKKELAAIYGMSPRSFANWMKPFNEVVGAKQGRYYNVHQVRMIIDKLGLPGMIGE